MDENFQRLIAGAFQEGFFAAEECFKRGKAVNQKNMEALLAIYLQKINTALEAKRKEQR